MAKATRLLRPSLSSSEQNQPLELLHTDVVGPTSTPSIAGSRCFMPVCDDCTALSMVTFLKNKSEAPKALQDVVKELQRIPACRKGRFRVPRIRSDNAKEYTTRKLKD